MSTDYKFTVKRKKDNKKLGAFYFNRIKNYYDIDATGLKLDPENISGDADAPTKIDINDVEFDIELLKSKISASYSKIAEKKLLIPLSANKDIKDELEADIFIIENEIKDLMYAFEAASAFYGILVVIVEDFVREGNSSNDDNDIAYCYNAEGLPNTVDGCAPHVWIDDIYVEAIAC